MVELTEIIEESNTFEDPQLQPVDDVVGDDLKGADLSDDEYDSEFEDDYDENETFVERLVALKDIIPPKNRQSIAKLFNATTVFMRKAFSRTGSLTWAITTSALLLGVPLSLSILGEQQLIEMEKNFDLQKDANDLLSQGDSAAVPASV
ncbi:hypothetical protein HG536_0D02990 [Torulaspora globosa]|uniref:Mitochondrial import receptor subunit TOM22 n=1 Tax=Torulaspora globosa TaxID=48254 RepID=A0A7G3ZGZ1_9SACH|nr:uncharacterized protein HG536_0D02990 [Torulaspora globosa]QLL32777.1 hypothetical protein HG536_0D02990 [Torulaspora globosa]